MEKVRMHKHSREEVEHPYSYKKNPVLAAAFHSNTTLTDCSDDLLFRNILTFKIQLHQLIIKVCCTPQVIYITPLAASSAKSAGISSTSYSAPISLIVPKDSLHLIRSTTPFEVFLCTNWDLNSNRVCT